MYLPKMNLISLARFGLCCGQIYTHARTHAHTTHTRTHRHFLENTYFDSGSSKISKIIEISRLKNFTVSKPSLWESKTKALIRLEVSFENLGDAPLIGNWKQVFRMKNWWTWNDGNLSWASDYRFFIKIFLKYRGRVLLGFWSRTLCGTHEGEKETQLDSDDTYESGTALWKKIARFARPNDRQLTRISTSNGHRRSLQLSTDGAFVNKLLKQFPNILL